MKIPKQIKIGGLTYHITFSPKECSSNSAFGIESSYKQKIFIDSNAPKERQEQTFFHEILHAIDHTFHCGPGEKESLGLTENQIKSFAAHLYLVLEENDLLKK